MGYGKPLVISLEDLNPGGGLYPSGASIFFPLHHVLVVMQKYVVVGE